MVTHLRRFRDWLSGESQKRQFTLEFSDELSKHLLRETIRVIKIQFLCPLPSDRCEYSERDRGYLDAVLDIVNFLDPDKTPPPTKESP